MSSARPDSAQERRQATAETIDSTARVLQGSVKPRRGMALTEKTTAVVRTGTVGGEPAERRRLTVTAIEVGVDPSRTSEEVPSNSRRNYG